MLMRKWVVSLTWGLMGRGTGMSNWDSKVGKWWAWRGWILRVIAEAAMDLRISKLRRSAILTGFRASSPRKMSSTSCLTASLPGGAISTGASSFNSASSTISHDPPGGSFDVRPVPPAPLAPCIAAVPGSGAVVASAYVLCMSRPGRSGLAAVPVTACVSAFSVPLASIPARSEPFGDEVGCETWWNDADVHEAATPLLSLTAPAVADSAPVLRGAGIGTLLG